MLRQLSRRLIANIGIRRTQCVINGNYAQFKYAPSTGELLFVRSKHVTSGIQGRRGSKAHQKKLIEDDEENVPLEEDEDEGLSLKDRCE